MPDQVEHAPPDGAPVLIAGPTASGKSRLALDLAAAIHGMVINADSMQVYDALRVLSARPSEADEACAPHRLYGHVPAGHRYSVGEWLADVAGALQEARRLRRRVIVVGGTGLYFRALTEGIAPIPTIPEEVRAGWVARSKGQSAASLHALLAERSREDAECIRPTDRNRILRALEVVSATGRSLAAWRREAGGTPIDADHVVRMVLDVDRAWLHGRISDRVDRMGIGAVEEVRALAALGLDPELPVMKAIGVRPFFDHIAGRRTREAAAAGCKTETRRYAKRQMTWFRHQMADWPRVAVHGDDGPDPNEVARLVSLF